MPKAPASSSWVLAIGGVMIIRKRQAISVAAMLLILSSFWAGDSRTVVAQQGGKGPPSKIASIVQDRIARIQAARGAAPAVLAASMANLSTDALVVTSDGQVEVEFHSANAVGPFEETSLIA